MPVTTARANGDFDPLHVTITQLPDGRIESVTMTDSEPTPEIVFQASAHSTVWTSGAPEHGDTSPRAATKVLDLAVSSLYRHEDNREWTNGEREADAFYAGDSPERTTLRAIEAHIIRAGHLEVSTGMVQCQGYGITLTPRRAVLRVPRNKRRLGDRHAGLALL